MWHVYVLRSLEHERFYTGMSEDPERRLHEHNDGKTKSTKAYRPWIKIFTEVCNSREEARAREKYLKSGVGREYIHKLWPGSSAG